MDNHRFTEKARAVIARTRDHAGSRKEGPIDMTAFLAVLGNDIEARVRLAGCLAGGDMFKFCLQFPDVEQPASFHGNTNGGGLEWDDSLCRILTTAADLASAEGFPDRNHPGLIDLCHLICAVAMSRTACRRLGNVTPLSREAAIDMLKMWYQAEDLSFSFANLVRQLLTLRSDLMNHVFGQNHAIHSFVEGLYNGQVTAAADQDRKRPSAAFVFVGPPGVGKTYMAEIGASLLDRPFKRFDMTGYSDHHAQNTLIGFAPSYSGAQPGLLTDFVAKHPNAILLFDEIEKAHLTTIQLFYQILDVGQLEDKFTKKNVNFRDTVIIFTTNAGSTLYDHPNKSGISAAHSSYQKRTILSALENEKNPADGRPAFPRALCSRLSQGYPVMFNYLNMNDLKRVCEAELLRTGALMEKQYFKRITYDEWLPFCLVFREGGRMDARQLRSESEKFVKGELFKYCSLYKQDRLEEVFDGTSHIHFTVEKESESVSNVITALFETSEKPKVLLAASDAFATLCRKKMPEIDWRFSTSLQDVVDVLSTEDMDMVLLDIWLQRKMQRDIDIASEEDGPLSGSAANTLFQVDFMPLSARALDAGREILRTIHARFPQTPTYILSFVFPTSISVDSGSQQPSAFDPHHAPPVDDELFLACVRSGGARGLVSAPFTGTEHSDWAQNRDAFVRELLEINQALYREKQARDLARKREILTFDSTARILESEQRIEFRLRNFSRARAVDGIDAGELLDDIERPTTRFADVIGAKSAKDSLRFLIDWLSDPKYYHAMGVRPPKGILLSGPPGTGKTMLARAVAGESNCAFIEKSASSFVTIWQGSGPQNVRDLFFRARRYAPTIVFIDELDAIGTKRHGSGGAGRAQEETLNAILTEMDGFRDHKLFPVIVLAATNLIDRLDDALKRRFDFTVELNKPDRAERLQYLKKTLSERKHCDVNQKTMDRLAGQTALLTIADLERIVQQASVSAAQAKKPLSDRLLIEEFEKFRMGESRMKPARETLLRTARHEAGHALIAYLGGFPPVQVTIVGRGNAGGYMEPEHDETKGSFTKSELEHLIRRAMAGRASEILYYGPEDGLDTGVASDLKKATQLATEMVTKWGMTKEFGHVSLFTDQDHRASTDGAMAVEVTRLASQIVKAQYEKALAILVRHRHLLDTLVDHLMEKNTLYKEDLRMVLPFPAADVTGSALRNGYEKRVANHHA